MDSQSRQEYVRAAISFLQNPKLVDSSLKDKLKFLQDKGLSELEVDEALNQALVNRHQTTGGRWNFVLILGLCVGGYKLYQTYLEQEKAKQDNQRTNRDAAQNKFKPSNIDSHLAIAERDGHDSPTLNDILQSMTELKKLIELQRSNLGTELQSLKTLLLGHEKFAAPPKIPDWQLPSADKSEQQPKNETNVKKKKSKISEASKPSASGGVFIEPTTIAPNPE